MLNHHQRNIGIAWKTVRFRRPPGQRSYSGSRGLPKHSQTLPSCINATTQNINLYHFEACAAKAETLTQKPAPHGLQNGLGAGVNCAHGVCRQRARIPGTAWADANDGPIVPLALSGHDDLPFLTFVRIR